MGQAIGQLLPIAIGIALSPLPVVAVILMLFTPQARTNGFAFLAGWAGGLLVVGAIVLWLVGATDAASDDGGESTLSGVVKLVLGALLLLLAIRSWRSRPAEGDEPQLPRWMSALDTFTAGKSLGMGALLSSVNPKNLALLLAGVATISAADLSSGASVATLVVFVVIASLSIAIPVGTYVVLGEHADAALAPAKDWLARNNAAVMAIVLLIFAAKLIGDGITILAA
jgi:threonine/homoserine/homoserine lactone efflux protein